MQTDEALAALENWQGLEDLRGEHLAEVGQRLMNLGASQRAEEVVQRLATAELDPRRGSRWCRSWSAPTVSPRLAWRSTGCRRIPPRASWARPPGVQAQIAQRESRHDAACVLFERALEDVPDTASRHFL